MNETGHEELSLRSAWFNEFISFGLLGYKNTRLPAYQNTRLLLYQIMTITPHQTSDTRWAEVASDEVLIHNIESGFDLMASIYFEGYEGVVLNEKNITPEFFDLSTKIAGEILQKFSNYRMKLAIVGDFQNGSTSLKQFISESNKMGNIRFVQSISQLG